MLTNEKGVLPGSDYYLGGESVLNPEIHMHLMSCGAHHCIRGYEIDRTYLDALLVVYVQEGTFFLHYDGVAYTTKSGDAVIIDCRRPQYYGSGDSCVFVWAHINQGQSFEMCEDILQKYGPVVRHEHSNRILERMLKILSVFRNEQFPTDSDISADLFALLCHFYKTDTLEAHQIKNHPIRVAIEYMKFHLTMDVSVDSVAAAVHMSKHYFSRLFKEHTGLSPHDYLVKLRLDLAKHLLTSTEMSVRDIAFEVGYKSDMGLITAFNEKVGTSPGRYRRLVS